MLSYVYSQTWWVEHRPRKYSTKDHKEAKHNTIIPNTGDLTTPTKLFQI